MNGRSVLHSDYYTSIVLTYTHSIPIRWTVYTVLTTDQNLFRGYDSDDTHHIWISLSRLEHLHRRTASLGCGQVAAATRGVLAVTAMAMMTHSSASRPSVDRIASSWPQPVTVFSCYRKQWLILQIKKQLIFIFNSILINLY